MLRNTLFLKVVISCLLGFCLLVIRISRSSVQLQQDPVEFQKTDIYNKLSQLRNKYVVQEEERNFPIAFSLVIYRDIDRAIRLLRAIYRPHNYYCIHVDKKANPAYFEAIQKAIRRIGSNVFLIPDSERISIVWGYLSTLDADLACAKRLLEFSSTWRYWINLTGHEFPLRTNWELVRALKAVRGANLVAGFRDVRDFGRLPPPSITPEGVRWYKGAVHVAVRREFIEYIFREPTAHRLLKSLRLWEVYRRFHVVADEQYFATLNNNPKVFKIPGAYTGKRSKPGELEFDVDLNNMSIMRHKVWNVNLTACGSNYWVRSICMLGVRDFETLKTSSRLFANKFIPTVEPEGYDRLEEWIAHKVEYERIHSMLHPSFNVTVYETLDQTKNHM
ncbi:Beta-1 3-galactosyl-O-glycosyl-glycoprotein beta-1 6-N-acetylglucosaminyltransferase [Fasciolopsis buskii]|uniref:Beta-1 3-galactosyl-O-glycosyl-glycoprotein beta-1 6-N-acetylglucosaminyltransferase n=1 Tax=Fasciolopsis buskii TaxID=27845 RepID=A0A8E0S2I4_9TREM|nr:Beta-1 3-galactosyl-O-glycosyl-glycoprotein beta-1 6-N-acetylglucosaminyltransferase [Fasciolopsis buski]